MSNEQRKKKISRAVDVVFFKAKEAGITKDEAVSLMAEVVADVAKMAAWWCAHIDGEGENNG